MRESSRAVLIAALALAAGCEPVREVEIIGTLAPEGEPVRAQLGDSPLGMPSVGLIGGDVLLSWNVGTPEPPDRTMPFRLLAAWVNARGERRGAIEDLGPSTGNPQQWVQHSGELFAQHWGDPLERRIVPPESERVFLLRAAPGTPLRADPIAMSLAAPGCLGCAQIMLGGITSGGIVPLPTVALDDRVIGGLTAMPAEPPCSGLGNYQRLHLFDDLALTGTVSSWEDDVCDPDPIEARLLRVENPFLFRLSSGEPAALVRWEGGERPIDVYLMRLDRDSLRAIGPPRRVGSDPPTGLGDGYQPVGASVDGHIVFSERSSSSNNYCHNLRVADDDGGNPHDAPWQLPCRRAPDQHWITVQPRLAAVPGGVLVVWDQRSGPLLIPSVAEHADYEDGLFAVVLTPEGRRGSEIFELTTDAHTAVFGDRPGQYRASIAADGDRVAVAWIDLHPDAPGIHIRVLRFTRDVGDAGAEVE